MVNSENMLALWEALVTAVCCGYRESKKKGSLREIGPDQQEYLKRGP